MTYNSILTNLKRIEVSGMGVANFNVYLKSIQNKQEDTLC